MTEDELRYTGKNPAVRSDGSREDTDEISLLDIAVVLAENARLLVLGPLLIGCVALGITFLISPIYTARTLILPPQQQQSAATTMLAQLGALSGMASTAAGLKNPVDQYVALLKSATIANQIVDRFDLVQLYEVDFRQDARENLEDITTILAGKEGLIAIEVDDKSPQRAADMANAYVDELQTLVNAMALTEAQQRRTFFEDQLKQTRGKLIAAEVALTKTGVTTAAIKANPEAAVEVVARLQAEVTAQEIRVSGLQNFLTDSAPELRQAQSELNALRNQLRKKEADGKGLPGAGSYIEKYREFKYQETLFEIFVRQFELAKADEAREGNLVQIVDRALPPERKSYPKKGLVAVIASVATGMILLLWIFLRRILRYDDNVVLVAAIRSAIFNSFPFRRGQR